MLSKWMAKLRKKEVSCAVVSEQCVVNGKNYFTSLLCGTQNYP
jgi:hypothetical protein